MTDGRTGTVLLYTIHRTDPWFRHVGRSMGFDRSYTVSDMRGEGDFCVADDFYRHEARFFGEGARESALLSAAEVKDVIARCRVLRFMGARRASSMALAMAEAFRSVLDDAKPDVILSFPVDRYVSDVLARVAAKRGVPFFELTVSAFSGMAMLMQRGVLCLGRRQPSAEEVGRHIEELTAPLFKPAYVRSAANFGPWRFLRVFAYFRVRGLFFWLLSLLRRDRLNLHYLDSQAFLGHKPHLADIRIIGMVDRVWRSKIEAFPNDKRVLFGLQLFPEASIDYWIEDLALIEHEDLVFEAARAFSADGYVVVVKDHPLQFGFRQVALIERLLSLPNVVLVPYDVSGMEVLSLCGVNFTCTGTLGLQAALAGVKSITTRNYYTTDGDFILLENRAQVARLPEMVEAFPAVADLPARRARIVARLLQGSFACDFFSFRGFDAANPSAGATGVGEAAGRMIRDLMALPHETRRCRRPPGPSPARCPDESRGEVAGA